MTLLRTQVLALTVLLLGACSHPIEIIGNGDVISASGTRDCTLDNFRAGRETCTGNAVIGDYVETYTAVPRDGWVFDRWQNYCAGAAGNTCRFNVPGTSVQQFYGQAVAPLVARFTRAQTAVYPYNLPDPLINEAGQPIVTASQWRTQRRPEIIQLFANQIYGKTPTAGIDVSYTDILVDESALGGEATRKQLRIVLQNGQRTVRMDLLVYVPNAAKQPVPMFFGMNFNGNHTIDANSAIRLPEGPVDYTSDRKASPVHRGNWASRWPVAAVIARGYGMATLHYADAYPDFVEGYGNGVHALFDANGAAGLGADEWGAIGAWAWGMSRVLDYFATDPRVDANKVALVGFSRLGKAALWAAAQDQRFALVISNNSGLLGASLARREGIAAEKEPLARLIDRYGYWFSANLAQYANNPGLLPVDQHQLIALMAPRPVYIASAQEDAWADPQGEYEAGFYAGEVYRLLGQQGLATRQMPALSTPLLSRVGYHIRPGEHDMTLYDWQQFLDFADIHLTGRASL
jgi:hypothetical protein